MTEPVCHPRPGMGQDWVYALWPIAQSSSMQSSLLKHLPEAAHSSCARDRIRTPRHEHFLNPVSYTHLDVYKRQSSAYAALRAPTSPRLISVEVGMEVKRGNYEFGIKNYE